MSDEVQNRVEKNLPLVEHIVTRLAARLPSHIERQELVQAGMVGLVEASQRYNPDLGTAFSTFAGRRIEGAIIDTVRRDDWLPRSLRSKARGVSTVEQDFFDLKGRTPTDAEISSASGLSVNELNSVRRDIHRGVMAALDRPRRTDDGATTLGESLADANAVDAADELENRELKAYVRSAVHLLPERHRLVVTAYFLEGRPMDEIAMMLGVTQSRISQLKDDALRRMREGLESQFDEADTGSTSAPRRRRDQRKYEYAKAIGREQTLNERLDKTVALS